MLCFCLLFSGRIVLSSRVSGRVHGNNKEDNMVGSFGIFLFEELPLSMVVCGFISQIAHLFILKTFPYVVVTSPAFLVAVVLLVVNHYLAFQYFASVYYSFSEVISYFTICLWLVPFTLFVSLSANENILPTVAETRPLLGKLIHSKFFNLS
uniref:Protein TEX261 n=1 Tax=Timema shepardi TaxID=629360 RepID=A0A7R9ALP5_TIMSH|nr:unnamed protein product [Timema shepardi]